MKHIIHVNQHIIKSNRKNKKKDHPITVKNYKKNLKSSFVEVSGPCRIIYSPDKPLPCGATVWIETESEVKA